MTTATLPAQLSPSPSLGEAGGYYLVSPSVIQPKTSQKAQCDQPIFRRGICEHGTIRWNVIPCRRRTCPVCGAERRRKAARRIRDGVAALGGDEKTAYWVGTFQGSPSKAKANRVLQKWLRWLRRDLGIPVQYAVVWEVQKRGALHCNVILSPWTYVSWRHLFPAWKRFGGGSHNWIDGYQETTPGEAVKTSRPRHASNSQEKPGPQPKPTPPPGKGPKPDGEPEPNLPWYLTKLEQMAYDGRAINYSRAWPKISKLPPPKRQGSIIWQKFRQEADQVKVFLSECQLGLWRADESGDWRAYIGEDCYCFKLRSGENPGPAPGAPPQVNQAQQGHLFRGQLQPESMF